MKAVILHGTGSSPESNWFPWTKVELEKLGYEVYVPKLPGADFPDIEQYLKFLLNSEWDFNENLIIGHSSGAVAILGLLQALPRATIVDTAILVGAFTERLAEDPKWEKTKGMFKKSFDFQKIKHKARNFIFIHSDNDPYCPIDQAQFLHRQVGGEFIILPGGQHFAAHLDPKYKRFPKLIEIIKGKCLNVKSQ